ncbi:MAG TPA: LytR C-terminal domain-containing protein, partial [Armatimonadota bacterium]|nr:LytR C-terminal domain-containing protein [Armatimonadota bacterium]
RTLVAQMRNPDKKDKIAAVGPLMDMVITDLKVNDALAVKQLVEKVGIDGIQTATLPTVPTKKGRADVVEVEDREQATQIINDLLHGQRPTVAVINGTRRSGLARDVSEAIQPDSFNVMGLGTTKAPANATQIFAKANYKTEAESLAAQLGIKSSVDTVNAPPPSDIKTSDTSGEQQITVIVGNDYQPIPSNEPTSTP